MEFVVIDNNSTDDTRSVARSFADRLRIRYLFQPRPGKNSALNMGLREATLGEIVVFTDDDVTPGENWIRAIADTTRRYPDYEVFGGRIDTIWPGGKAPGWLQESSGRTVGLGGHDPGEEEGPYPPRACPCGANFWVRRQIFTNGLRYDENVGPHPTNRIMGSETCLFLKLASQGKKFLYVPSAIIGHRIERDLVSGRGIRRRARTMGRGGAYRTLFCEPPSPSRASLAWRMRRVGALGWSVVRYLRAMCSLTRDARLGRSLEPISDIAYNLQMLRAARRKFRNG